MEVEFGGEREEGHWVVGSGEKVVMGVRRERVLLDYLRQSEV